MSQLGAQSVSPWTRRFVTPEGVDLRLELSSFSQRAGALVIDISILVAVLIVLTLFCLLTALGGRNPAALPVIGVIWLLGFFLLRNGYFLAFELGPRAATPGKRIMKLRVAMRDGGALTATAVFARNAMREIEFYLPATFLLIRGRGVDAVLILLGLVWTGALVLFPLFNRDRLRLGDLLAGTWVVLSPAHRLLPDMAAPAVWPRDTRLAFGEAQLKVYGVKELQVLEQVLRRRNMGMTRGVAERIRAKIGWTADPLETDFEFLDAYYLALRAHLEQQMLLGRRRRDKFDTV